MDHTELNQVDAQSPSESQVGSDHKGPIETSGDHHISWKNSHFPSFSHGFLRKFHEAIRPLTP